nr:hypothetical protein [Panacagrimonas sp.]
MTIETTTVTALDDGTAHVELRKVRDPLDFLDDINDRFELWAVNESSSAVCVQNRSRSGYINGHHLVGPGESTRLLQLGRSAEGSAGIVVPLDGETCDAALFKR